MLSSFPSFGGLIHNPSTTNTLENINPWFNGLISTSPTIPFSTRPGLMQLPGLEVNNWGHNNNRGFHGTSILNQLGLVSSPNNSTASTVSSSSPRLGLNLQAMDFLGNNSSFSAQTRTMTYDAVDGEEGISPNGIIMSNKVSVYQYFTPMLVMDAHN